MASRAAEYKPLSFTTTIRSPERIRSFLKILKRYNGKVLTEDLIYKILSGIIGGGHYRPTGLTDIEKGLIDRKEKIAESIMQNIFNNNPQEHKEAGFPRGWPSRFDTFFKFPKELGLVYYKLGEKIMFSDIGLKLIDEEHPEFEQQVFLNAFVKYQSNNPFRRVLNENKPLILLLEVIRKLNRDKRIKTKGISRFELPLLLYWKDSDAEALYSRIVLLREKYNLTPSKEVIVGICQGEIMQGNDRKRNVNSITNDSPDEFIRKMRLTGLISLRGMGRFIDINENEKDKIDYIIGEYSQYEKYSDELAYFEHISQIDPKLFSILPKTTSAKDKENFLLKWTKQYSWQDVKQEILKLVSKRLSKDEILRVIPDPCRLEFLVAIALKQNFPEVSVIPNYPTDDEGLPTSTAPGVGDTGDIECVEGKNGILVEVTMLEGRQQTVMEVWPVTRHLEKFCKKHKYDKEDSLCYFVAPSIFKDSERQAGYVKDNENLYICLKTVKEFIEHLETNEKLFHSAV